MFLTNLHYRASLHLSEGSRHKDQTSTPWTSWPLQKSHLRLLFQFEKRSRSQRDLSKHHSLRIAAWRILLTWVTPLHGLLNAPGKWSRRVALEEDWCRSDHKLILRDWLDIRRESRACRVLKRLDLNRKLRISASFYGFTIHFRERIHK